MEAKGVSGRWVLDEVPCDFGQIWVFLSNILSICLARVMRSFKVGGRSRLTSSTLIRTSKFFPEGGYSRRP